MKPVVTNPRATADLDDLAAYLQRQSPAAALRLLQAVQSTYQLLSEHPRIGSARYAVLAPDLPVALRFHPLKKFPRYLAWYVDLPRHVEVLRIRDAARDLKTLMDEEL